MKRWAISRNLLLALAVLVGLAFAGRSSLFGKKKAEEPPPEPVEAPPAEPAVPTPPPPPEAGPMFPNGVPVALQQTPDGLANLSAQGCNGCHYAAHEAWSGTGHATAWSDPAYQEAISRVGGSTVCLGCHLPLANQHGRLATGYVDGDLARPDPQINALWDPTLMSEGVTCAACHVRNGQVVGTRPAPGAPHVVAVSAELSSSAFCATCHQLTWPEADQPFYDTYGEWKGSAYSDAGVRCQDCHMPPRAGPATATRFASVASHGFDADLSRALSVLVRLDAPELRRGEPFTATVSLQNTGAGHHVPTGSPFKAYRVSVDVVDIDGKTLAKAHVHDLGRIVEDAPPWNTLSDTRIAAGGEVVLTPAFEISQKVKATTAILRVTVRRVVGDDASEPLIERTIPLPLL
jgi:hypothetical protein